ncbi:MAG: hypothetical protein LBS16_05230 [Prevotellaceae bacterium]|nr:hypothetical protein [Prevotellaceae bacterium]
MNNATSRACRVVSPKCQSQVIIQPIRVDVQRIAMSVSCTYGYSHFVLADKTPA